MLKNLSQLRIWMIGTGLDIVIGESIAKALIKFFQNLTQTSSIHLNEKEKP